MLHCKRNVIIELSLWTLQILSGAFVFWGLGDSGFVLMNDSMSYIVGFFGREPLYPVIIHFFEWVFRGRELGLFALYVFQGICGLSSCLFVMYIIRKRFNLGCFLSIISWGLLLMPFFFDSFFEEGVVYSHFIMTECLSDNV